MCGRMCVGRCDDGLYLYKVTIVIAVCAYSVSDPANSAFAQADAALCRNAVQIAAWGLAVLSIATLERWPQIVAVGAPHMVQWARGRGGGF